ncbi:MAG TPA: L,D-transpeptidase family protein [Acidimicrobiales bacterium]
MGVCILVAALLATGSLLLAHSQGSPASADPKPAVLPLNVVGTTPADSASDVASSATISVALSAPLAPDSPMPSLSPPVTGTWAQVSPNDLEFVPAGPLVPGAAETLTVPGGRAGLRGAQGQHLATTTTSSFTVAPGSVLRLQQLLAELGYLPLTFTPAAAPTSPQQAADPQLGAFSWRWANQPASLTSLWTEGSMNVITKGAVMSFESQHGLTTDGLAGPQVWTDLLAAAASGSNDPQAYGYVLVSQSLPESATVYQNGAAVYSTAVNTGVTGATTAPGTFPVYERFTVTTMRGTNPDGTKYVDPGIPWVSYFNGGDALHGFVRAGYGYPQSDGCVEMPPSHAEVVYPMTPIGTLVTVT